MKVAIVAIVLCGVCMRLAGQQTSSAPPSPAIHLSQSPPIHLLPAPKKVTERTKDSAVFSLPKDVVWAAMMESLTAAKLSLKTADAATGTVVFEATMSLSDQWGGANDTVKTISTRTVTDYSTWKSVVAVGNVLVKTTSPGQCRISISVSLTGLNEFVGIETLESNGYIEGELLDAITARLPDPTTMPAASCTSLFKSIANKKLSDLTVKQDADRKACEAAGFHP